MPAVRWHGWAISIPPSDTAHPCDWVAGASMLVRREAIEIRSTTSAREALGWIAADEVAVLVSDYEMPEMTGAQLAGHARRVRPETGRILLTGKRTLATKLAGHLA